MRFRIAIAVLFVGLVAAWVSRERPAATVSHVAPMEPAASPAQQVAALKAAPTPHFLAFQATSDGGFTPMVPFIKEEGRWKNLAKPVEPTFPPRFSEAVRVRSGVADVRATPVGGNSASTPRVSDDGSLVYADAFPGCDVKYRCERLKTEEFIVVKDAAAQTSWSWDLDLNGLMPRYTQMDTVELIDGNGVPRLRIDAPFGADAKGKKLRVGEGLAFKVDGRRLTLTADLKDCAFPVEIDPSWSSTGNSASQYYPAAGVLLKSGKVLLTGALFSEACEIFDPDSGTWRATGSMLDARARHTAVLLADGKVLIAGGRAADPTPYTTCQIFEPETETWSFSAGGIAEGRELPTLTLLDDGRVLMTGGHFPQNGAATASSEVFNPATGTWAATTNSMSSARTTHCAQRLTDGRVLISGGGLTTGGGGLQSCDIFDPSSDEWSPTGSLAVGRKEHVCTALENGAILVSGGTLPLNIYTGSTEIFEPASGQWRQVGTAAVKRNRYTATRLIGGKVLVAGGLQADATTAELYDPNVETWSSTQPTGFLREDHLAFLLGDGRVAIVGGQPSNVRAAEIYDPRPVVSPLALNAFPNVAVSATPTVDAIYLPVQLAITSQPAHGTVSTIGSTIQYTADPTYLGTDSFQIKANDGFQESAATTVTITVLPSPPVISSGPLAAPNPSTPGESVQFSVAATDAQALTYSWNLGDGSSGTGASPSHTYAAVGEYNAAVTITDAAGTVTTGGVLVKVSAKPTARFTTTDIVAFEDTPFGFDASFSTDPENAIVSYAWDFGDGSPAGSGQVISRTYTQQGSYTVTLTITDAAGQVATTSREIEVLDGSQLGLFNSAVEYAVKWDRQKTNADTLTFSATVNVGDTAVGNGSAEALEIAGTRFTGTLDKRLADKRNKNVVWSVKAGTKRQSAGEVSLSVKIKKANLGLGFNQAGALAGNDPKAVVRLEIPVRLEIAGRAFELLLDSEFKFSKGGTSAKGSGEGP